MGAEIGRKNRAPGHRFAGNARALPKKHVRRTFWLPANVFFGGLVGANKVQASGWSVSELINFPPGVSGVSS